MSEARTRVILVWWWILFLGATLLERGRFDRAADIEALIQSSYQGVAAGILWAVAALLAIRVVVRIERWQSAAWKGALSGAPRG